LSTAKNLKNADLFSSGGRCIDWATWRAKRTTDKPCGGSLQQFNTLNSNCRLNKEGYTVAGRRTAFCITKSFQLAGMYDWFCFLLLVEQGKDTIISTDLLGKVGTCFDVSE
jgi:hypothetical protein